MLLQRAIIALTLGPLALFLVYLGGWFFFIPLAAILVLASVEYVHMANKLNWHLSAWVLAPLVFAQFIVAWWPQLGLWPQLNLDSPLMLLSLFIIMLYALWLYERKNVQAAPATWMGMIGGLMLFGWVASHFFRLRGLDIESAWKITILALVATWSADSGAYLTGRFLAGNILGKHRLSPRLSPNKTVEGYIGGIIFGTAVTLIAAAIMQLPLVPALVIGIIIGIVGTFGDLAISLLKRESGVKDSGTIFKEHGGALDRIDSLIWSVAITYYLVLFLNQFMPI